ncbi:tetratricopeptide repeat protein [Victivallis vadensis]|uniref:tetratricopeptide repeat protein n=1 Tax=Victivallis vadensis TaxID=172901 RepID=UPI0026DC6CBD|nr:hypothetical protein [Victivallis vadensis]
MKYLFLLLCPLVCWGAVDFQTAESLFEQGKVVECHKLIGRLFHSSEARKLTETQRMRLVAIQEYLSGSSPELIEETLKEARAFTKRKGVLTLDLLNYSTVLVRRAADWKKRAIPEYQELSDLANELLEHIRDEGDPAIALKVILLKTKNHNLNGEYRIPIKLISYSLQFYYPKRVLQSRNIPDGALRLLMLGGEQYEGLAALNSDVGEKVQAYSTASKYYLRAINGTSPSSPFFQQLSDRLHYCKETLRLLGYDLKLPSRIKPRSRIDIHLIDEMLSNSRFQDIVIALENNYDLSMQIRYAVALAALGDFEKLSVLKEHLVFSEETKDFILDIARYCLAAGKNEDGLFFLQKYLAVTPSGPEATLVYMDCARLVATQEQYKEAADYLLKLAEMNKAMKEEATWGAAKYLYLANDLEACLKLSEEFPDKARFTILASRTCMRRGEENRALQKLEELLKQKEMSAAEKTEALELAIACARKHAPSKAMEYCWTLLKENPEFQSNFPYAALLPELYSKNPAGEKACYALGELMLKHQYAHPELVPFLVKCAEKISSESLKEKLLEKIPAKRKLSAGEQLALLAIISSEKAQCDFLQRHVVPLNNTPEIIALFLMRGNLYLRTAQYEKAVSICENLQKLPAGKSFDCKILRARISHAQKQYKEARQAYQELLLHDLPPDQKKQIVLELAQCCEKSGEAAQAIAVAWSVVPLVEVNLKSEEAKTLKLLLELIIRCASQIGSQEDQQDAQMLLEQLKNSKSKPPV